MKNKLFWTLSMGLSLALGLSAQNPPQQQGQQTQQQGQRGAGAAGGGGGQRGGGGGRGRGGIQSMALTTSAWLDGARIPVRFTQVGAEVSPPIAWSDVPENTSSFVLIVHDL